MIGYYLYLNSKNKKLLFAVVRLLGRINNNKAVIPVINLLNKQIKEFNPNEYRHSYGSEDITIEDTIRTLGILRDERAIEPLVNLLSNNNNIISIESTIALGEIGSDKASDALIKVINDGISVKFAINALGKIKSKKAVDTLIYRINDPDQDIQSSAISALGKIGDSRAIRPLLKYYQNRSVKHRLSALISLSLIGDKQVIPDIIASMDGLDPNSVSYISDAMCRFGDAAVLPLINELNDSNAVTVGLAIRSLGDILDPRAIPAFIRIINDPTKPKRSSAVYELGKFGEAETIDTMISVIRDPDYNVRMNAVDYLGKWRSEKAIYPLISVINDPLYAKQRDPVLKALYYIIDKQLLIPLLESLENSNEFNRKQSILMLSELGAISYQPLIEYYRDPISEEPGKVLNGLCRSNFSRTDFQKLLIEAINNPYLIRKIGIHLSFKDQLTNEMTLPLIDSLSNDNILVRNSAIEILGQIKDPRAVLPLIRILPTINNSEFYPIDLIINMLRDTGDPRAIEPIIQLLEKTNDAGMAFRYIDALARFKDPRAVQPIIRKLGLSSQVYSFGLALGQIGDPSAIEPLKMHSQANPSDCGALIGLLMLGDERAWEQLSDIADNPSKRVLIYPYIPTLIDMNEPRMIDFSIKLLNTNNYQIQERAVIAFGEKKCAHAVEPLIRIMNGEIAGPANAASKALCQIGDPKGIRAVIDYIDKNPSNSDHVFTTLAENGNPAFFDDAIHVFRKIKEEYKTYLSPTFSHFNDSESIQKLVRLMTAENDEDDIYFQKALMHIGKPAAPYLIAALPNSSGRSFRLIIQLLGWIADPQAVDVLLPLLNHNDPSIQAIAADALGWIGDPRAVPDLILSLNSPDSAVRAAAAFALGHTDPKQAIDPLKAALTDSDARVRQWAVYAFMKTESKYSQTILPLLQDSSIDVRVVTVMALGKMKEPVAIDPLIARLSDPEIRVVTQAIIALSRIPNPKTINAIAKKINDENEYVFKTSIRVLNAIDDPAALDILIASLSSDRLEIRKTVFDALLNQKDPRVNNAFVKMLNEKDKRLLKTVIETLGERRVESAVVPLCDILKRGEDYEVLKALRNIGDKRAILPILERLENKPHLPMFYVDALQALTGQTISENPVEWRRWYEANIAKPR